MAFHLGKPILFMSLISALGGGWLLLHREPARKDLTLWVFAPPQFHAYNDVLCPSFESQSGKSLEVDLVPSRAMDMRLPVLFMSQGTAAESPDAVEVAVDSMGRYLRPPIDQIGFLPLNGYLEKSGWKDRILASRLLSAAKDGRIFGIPHDVHPVALAFRDDLFREAGVPLINSSGEPTVATWAEFQDKCLKFQAYWRARGFPTRHAIELPQSDAGTLSILLHQRHVNLVDADYTVHLNDPKVAQTLAFYAGLVAGDGKIGAESAADSGMEYSDLAEGNICSLLMPDWKVEFVRQSAPGLCGKMRMISLPRFDAADAPTASYGGTLICIPRLSAHPDEAWKLIEFLYFSRQSLAAREQMGILPPIPQEWDGAAYRAADPFFGGQRVLKLYAGLARQMPPASVSPVNSLALGTLSYVQSKAEEYLNRRGPEGLEEQCQKWLDDATVDLKQRIAQVRFD